MLGKRKANRVVKALLARHHYTAVLGMLKYYDSPLDGFIRYTFGRGSYPHHLSIKTPIGLIKPILYSHHDMLTINEIFCRQDYEADINIKVIVDLGSNIGLSALYFLTRNKNSKCYLYEPVPENIKKLKHTLSGFEDRYNLTETAVSDESGKIRFGVEKSGRYGGLSKEMGSKASPEQPVIDQEIMVDCLAINDILEEVFSHERGIDILKIDIEGAELKTAESINEEYLRKIKLIYIESPEPPKLQSSEFSTTKFRTVYRSVNGISNDFA